MATPRLSEAQIPQAGERMAAVGSNELSFLEQVGFCKVLDVQAMRPVRTEAADGSAVVSPGR